MDKNTKYNSTHKKIPMKKITQKKLCVEEKYMDVVFKIKSNLK